MVLLYMQLLFPPLKLVLAAITTGFQLLVFRETKAQLK